MEQLQKNRIEQSSRNREEYYGTEPSTFQEVFDSVIAVTNGIFKQSDSESRLVGLAWDLKYADSVSNSHSSPVTGVSNWGGRIEGARRGYSGMEGRVWARYSANPRGASNALNQSCLQTGSGGSGTYDGLWSQVSSQHYTMTCNIMDDDSIKGIVKPDDRYYSNKNRACDYLGITHTLYLYSWGGHFFLPDFPVLEEEIDNQLISDKITGNEPMKYHSKLSWTHEGADAVDETIRIAYNKLFAGGI